MQDDEPRAEEVYYVVEVVSVGDAVDRCAAGEDDEEDLCYDSETVRTCQPWKDADPGKGGANLRCLYPCNHAPGAERLHE